MKINETSNNSFQNKVLIDTFIEQISALQTDVGDLQIADDNLAQALAAKANTADISNEVSTGTLNATNGNIKTLKVRGPGSEATLENATIGEATIGTENVTQSNITNLEVMDVDAGTVRAGTIVVENDATISGNLAVQDIGAKDITSASVNTLNLTAAEADINKLEAHNAEVTGKLEVNDLEVSGNFTGVSSIESESIESENITSDNADIETLNVKNIRDWVSQIMNQEQMLTPSPQLGNVDRYTIELPSFNGVFLLSWEDSDVLWSATVIGNGKSYGISWGSKTEENYITDLFQYNGKLYIRINCNGKLKYAYSATKELSPITIYFNMDGWTKEKSLEELCDEESHIENAYPTGTAWLGPVFIPRLVEGESSGSGINFKGSCSFAEIPSFTDTLAGDVWNITDEAYTDNRFVEGAGKPINAGDDIVAVKVKLEGSNIINGVRWDSSLFPGQDISANGQFFVHLSNGSTLIFANETSTGNIIVAKYNGPNDYTFITRFYSDHHLMFFGIQRPDGRIMLFGSGDDYWYSDDLGENWNSGTSVPAYDYERSWADVQYANGVFVATDDEYNGNYYLASLDNGENWQYIGDSYKQIEYDGYNYRIEAATVLSDGKVLIYASCYDLQETYFFTSTDLNNWTKLPITLSYNDTYSYFFKVNENIMLLISDDTEYNPDDGKYYHRTFRINFNERTFEEVALLPDFLFSTGFRMHNRIINATGERIQLADGHYSDNIGTTWQMLADFPTGGISYALTGVNQVSTDTLAFTTRGGSSSYPDYLFYQQYSEIFLRWDKFSAGVNYEDFVAEKITATESLKSEGTFEVDGESTFNDDITQTGDYTATGDLNRTGNETIIGTVVIGDLD